MIGERLGHFEIAEQVGAGAMGVVYRARDTRLERDVALKLLSEDVSAAERTKRLLQEARAASALNHPHIATIYETGEAKGHPYIAMEYVRGESLSTRIPTEGLPGDTVLRFGAQIASALAHAHQRGVIHRDLKCANIVIAAGNQAKVLDFGLARRVLESPVDQTRTASNAADVGNIAGTLRYMSPEILRGRPANALSDIWALGVVLYEMSAGRPPFDGRTAFELTSAILQAPTPPPPAHIPPGLGAIIRRCLEKDLSQRYQSADDVRAALESLPQEMPVSTLSTGGKRSANADANESFERAMLFLTVQYDLARSRQMLERALQLDSDFVEARAWYGYTHLLQVDTGFANDRSWLYRAEEEIRRAFHLDAASARAHMGLAAIQFYRGRMDQVRSEAERALALRPGDPDAVIWLATAHLMQGHYDAAERLLRPVVERHPLLFAVRWILGDTLRESGDNPAAIREFQKILEQDPRNLYAVLSLARSHLHDDDLHAAARVLDLVPIGDRQNFYYRLHRSLLLAASGQPDSVDRELDNEVLKYAEVAPYATLLAAECYAVASDSDRALDWLERSVQNGDQRAEWFRRNRLLANIRRHPRFEPIVASIAFMRLRSQN